MRFVLLLLFVFLSYNNICLANSDQNKNFNLSTFKTLPVVHQGRIKPLDSVARVSLDQIYGSHVINGQSAISFWADTAFHVTHDNNRQENNQSLFYLRDKAIKTQYGLNVSQTHFSLPELESFLKKTSGLVQALVNKPAGEITKQQDKILNLHNNVRAYINLMRGFSLFLPVDVVVDDSVIPGYVGYKNPRYIDVLAYQPVLKDMVQKTIENKGDNPDAYTDIERVRAILSYKIETMRTGGEESDVPRIFPVTWDADNTWYSPWALLLSGKSSPRTKVYIDIWADIMKAYREGDHSGFEKHVQRAHEYSTQYDGVSPLRLKWEVLYNTVKPFSLSLILYGFVLICGIFYWGIPHIKWMHRVRTVSRKIMVPVFVGALLTHVFGLISRIVILSRPPVGTLYESLLYVSLICALGALWFALKKRTKHDEQAEIKYPHLLYAMLGAITGAGLLMIAPYVSGGGDDMEMLVAVLNTNFWLATHVIIITAGYGVCILAACLSHIYLFQSAKESKKFKLIALERRIHHVSLVALLLTAVGTALGGIWADQSWGRFWGWDPKENGALLIVLWLIWAHHGRMSGYLNFIAFAAVIGALNIVVALAWFGVNLLGVGLHSYGFITGVALALGTFCMSQSVVLGALWYRAYLSRKEGEV